MSLTYEQSQEVVAAPGEAAIFMVFTLKDTPSTTDQIKEICGDLGALIKSLNKRFPEGNLLCTMGFGAYAWSKLFPNLPKPVELAPFTAIEGTKYTAVSTPGDILFHIRAARMDLCQELAAMIAKRLAGAVCYMDEIQGFRYFDGRTIIGFVDGTENPEGEEAQNFTQIGTEDPFFTGGSYAFVQKYLHDMTYWDSLSTEEQEKTIGRRKLTDEELSDEEKPKNAHVAVTNITDDEGNELKIMRANMPFAYPTKGEFGTYFIGYSKSFKVTERMLRNMFIGEPEGNYDRLLDFSHPVTGTLFFIPSSELLEQLAQ